MKGTRGRIDRSVLKSTSTIVSIEKKHRQSVMATRNERLKRQSIEESLVCAQWTSAPAQIVRTRLS